MEKLKPCRVCGRKPIFCDYNYPKYKYVCAYTAVCRSKRGFPLLSDWKDNVEDAIEDWNNKMDIIMPEEHQDTDEIVCPYCGSEFSDSCEYKCAQDIKCHECEKVFSMEPTYSATYTTSKKE